MYEVLRPFADGENGNLLQNGATYAEGDEYPKNGFEPSKEHIAYLKGRENAFGEPVIKEVKPQGAKPQRPEKEPDKGK